MIKHKLWISNIERKKSIRKNIIENYRLDMSERTLNYPKFFFNEFLSSLSQEDFVTYPSIKDYEILEDNLADKENLTKDNICILPSSDVAIKTIFELVCEPGSEVVSSDPCFPMYNVYCKMFDCKFIGVKYDSSLKISLEKLKDAVSDKTRLVVLANPNNPIGDWKNNSEIEELCRFLNERNILLFIDEAYYEYSPGSSVSLLKKFNNLIISRTFSKAFGAAGIRLGHVISSKDIISLILKLRFMFPIPTVSIKFAMCLLNNFNYINDYVADVIKEKKILISLLENSKYDVLDSNCNWIHFNNKNNNSNVINVFDFYNVSTKVNAKIPFDDRDNWIRLTIGPGIHNLPFIQEIL